MGRNKEGLRIDAEEIRELFLTPGISVLIQVSESLHDPDTRKLEVRALTTAMREQSIATGTIVTLTEKSTIKTEVGAIEVVPAWEFLLNQR